MTRSGGALVEFCGLPGTGKTTLARAVVAHLEEWAISAAIVDDPLSAVTSKPRRIAQKAIAAMLEAVHSPAATLDAGRCAAVSRQESARDAVAWLAQWLAVRRAIARARREPGPSLIEEGVVQSLWTLGLRARGPSVARFLERTPRWARGDLLVVVEAPADAVLERLAARSSRHSRTQRLSPGAQAAELRRGETLLAELVAASGVPVLRLANDRMDDVPGLARMIVDRVFLETPV